MRRMGLELIKWLEELIEKHFSPADKDRISCRVTGLVA